ncbi:glycosyl transferase [Geomonas sp. Red276]
MRVAMIAPNYTSGKTGNFVTVSRLERHLRDLGCEVKVFGVDRLTAEKLLQGVNDFAPQLLHAFHGYSGGRVAHALAEELGIRYLVTITGTDVYQTLIDQRSHETHLALRGAERLVVFDCAIKRRLAEHLPSLEPKTTVIAQGVDLLEGCQGAAEDKGDAFTFLFPAGLRPVKNVLFPLAPLQLLHAVYPQIRLQLVGPVMDSAYAEEVLNAVENFPFARYLGEVPHHSMAALYRGADVVLNCSFFEGGMANALLEAMACGKAVLASDIEGSRSIVKEGVTGLLYRDEAEFRHKAERLINDPHLREQLGNNACELVAEKHSPEAEAQAYLELYQSILAD